MSVLALDVRLDGFVEPVGALARSADGALSFAYTAAHLARADALAHAAALAGGLCAILDELARKGMKLHADLIAANLRQLLPVLGVEVPAPALDRDAFVERRSGGWLMN